MSDAWHFEIRLVKGELSVMEYANGTQQALKNNGEEVWAYTSDFWQWLADKIKYDGEPISFVVICDHEDFPSPPEQFQLSTQNFCYQDIAEGEHYYAYPELTMQLDLSKCKPVSQVASPKVKGNSLQAYFVRQTKEYQEG